MLCSVSQTIIIGSLLYSDNLVERSNYKLFLPKLQNTQAFRAAQKNQ